MCILAGKASCVKTDSGAEWFVPWTDGYLAGHLGVCIPNVGETPD